MPLMNKSLFWAAISAAFSVFVGLKFGLLNALSYLACYTTEIALSLDNLLMFYVIFKYFNLNTEQQKKALNIGVWSAIVLRLIMISTGSWFLNQFSWVAYIFAAFLAYLSFNILFISEDEDKEPQKLIQFMQKYLPFLSVTGVVICVIEITDIMFALDSVPATLGITKNYFIVWSANVFAILGLRSLYFLMLKIIDKFKYLEKLVAMILFGVALKFIIGG